MGYAIYNLRDDRYGRKSSDTKEFYEAMDMAKEGLERVCELAEEMIHEYGGRGSYGRREEWDDDDMRYGERRRRDSRGRYM
jgi:hypothetical protein